MPIYSQNFEVNSSLNPFITDMTIIKVATPNAIPANEINVIIEKNFSFVFGKETYKRPRIQKTNHVLCLLILFILCSTSFSLISNSSFKYLLIKVMLLFLNNFYQLII